MLSGVCRFCGCTNQRACHIAGPEGTTACEWVDPDQTVCSACVGRLSDDELGEFCFEAMREADAVGGLVLHFPLY